MRRLTSFADAPVMEFFKTSIGDLLTYEEAAGVGHHVALSLLGTDQLPDSGYLRAKVTQEKLTKESSIPYSIHSQPSPLLQVQGNVRLRTAKIGECFANKYLTNTINGEWHKPCIPR
jgi:hypothetical protein